MHVIDGMCRQEIPAMCMYKQIFFLLQIFKKVDELFPLLLKTLSDPSDEVWLWVDDIVVALSLFQQL